jgi:hypothetical protein
MGGAGELDGWINGSIFNGTAIGRLRNNGRRGPIDCSFLAQVSLGKDYVELLEHRYM